MNKNRDVIFFLIKEAKSIDVLQLYHVTSNRNYLWIMLYKILNPKGKYFIKMDTDYSIFSNYDFYKKGFKSFIKRVILRNCDLISVETKSLAEKLSSKWNIDIKFITNGYCDLNNGIVDYKNKENIILTVGRLGTRQKNTEELLEAFAIFSIFFKIGN